MDTVDSREPSALYAQLGNMTSPTLILGKQEVMKITLRKIENSTIVTPLTALSKHECQ